MKRLLTTFLLAGAILTAVPVLAPAQQAPVKPAPPVAGAGDKLTIRECLGILTGLQFLDGRKIIVAAGKPNESVEVVPYKFPGRLRDAVSHNLFMLAQVQQEAQAANRRTQMEVGKGREIRPGSAEAIELDIRLNEYIDRPCNVQLDHFADADLRLDDNDIPGSVLATLWRLRDR